MAKNHDRTKLPRWAQRELALLEQEIRNKDKTIAALREAHAVLFGASDWVVLPGPPESEGGKFYHLWRLNHDSPHSVCSLGPGDKLLVGRAPKKDSQE